ncbi:MAG: DUF1232 domain-containing protein [Anaerolinea sp.]|nr:DUF1232 domain-containing protein [Anaerolinea sp.]
MGKFLKNILVLGVGAVGVLYLINPTAGFLEFIPDNLPLVGNLDEGAAMVLIIGAARYYGIDLSNLFKREDEKQLPPETQPRKQLPPR